MSSTYQGDPTNNPDLITIPSDGDAPIQVSDVNTAFQGLADKIESLRPLKRVCMPRWLYKRTPAAATTSLNPATEDVFSSEYYVPDTAVKHGPNGVLFEDLYGAGAAGYVYMADITHAMVDGRTLDTAKLYLDPLDGRGALSDQMPAIAIVRTSHADVRANLLSTIWQVDPSGSVAVYEAGHDVTFTPDQNNVIDLSTYTYAIHLITEGDAGGDPGDLFVGSLELNFTVT